MIVPMQQCNYIQLCVDRFKTLKRILEKWKQKCQAGEMTEKAIICVIIAMLHVQ